MTLSPWTIYLWGISDQIRDATVPVSIFSGIVTIIGIMSSIACYAEDVDEPLKVCVARYRNAITAIFALSVFAYAAVPSSKTIAMMVVLPAIVNSEPIQKDLPEVYKMAVDALKAQLTPDTK